MEVEKLCQSIRTVREYVKQKIEREEDKEFHQELDFMLRVLLAHSPCPLSPEESEVAEMRVWSPEELRKRLEKLGIII